MPLKVAIVGGSLAGLMCGIALKHGGHDVVIFEQDENERQSHQAGIGLGPAGEIFTGRHDRLTGSFTHTTNGVKSLDNDGTFRVVATGRRQITSWDTLYLRLRSIFDGYRGKAFLIDQPEGEGDGTAIFHSKTKVIDFGRDSPSSSKLNLTILDIDTKETSRVEADMVIGADGPDSGIRRTYMPEISRKYAGYIAWRGTVPARDVSRSTRDAFQSAVVAYTMQGQHLIAYSIPGTNGALEPSERHLNFLWYTNESLESLSELMVDGKDGHRHHNTVPSGHVRKETWSHQLEVAQSLAIPAPFLDLIEKIEHPFIQVISDFCSPQASFEDGKVLLVGDAVSLFRPHAAMGGAQAAYHALAVEELASGRISLGAWEDKVTRFSYLHWLQSVWWGDFYQRNLIASLPRGLHYWIYWIIQRTGWW
ncbi:hypothetical protein F4780DRAFT_788769 [Xylariomycetidae sp. FL0641]|nr:hypothetical protein F4780DRAFT_788769 [Xylariomycetidae sp. FL0641]